MRKVYIDSAYRTDIGLKRELNEDYCFSASDHSGVRNDISGVLAVSDGMGGHDAGDIASKMTCEYLEHLFVRGGSASLAQELGVEKGDLSALLNEVFRRMNKRIVDRAKSFDLLRTMGCTCVVALLSQESATGSSVLFIGWVGDSRCYIVRDDDIFLATEDDSYVWDLYKKGKITYQEMRVHPKRNVLTQALGTVESISPRFNRIRLQPDDIVLLCSDGLHGFVTDHEMKNILRSSPDAETAAQRLVEAANSAGGKDNISVAVAYCLSEPARSSRGVKTFSSMGRLVAASGVFGLLAVGAFLLAEPFQESQPESLVVHRVRVIDRPSFSRVGETVSLAFSLEPYERISKERARYRLMTAVDGGTPDTLVLSDVVERNRNMFVVPLPMKRVKTQTVRLTLMRDATVLTSDAGVVEFKQPPSVTADRRRSFPEVNRIEERPMFRLTRGIDGKIQIWVTKDYEIDEALELEISGNGEKEIVRLTKKNRNLPKASTIKYVPGERVMLRVAGSQKVWAQTLS
ncbi:MAG: serine/threonine-protein phosphatase [Ignavibacteriales bacterium]|nr:serine/threonine-protein phosphatase [Ignavibacteriales bacterium]